MFPESRFVTNPPPLRHRDPYLDKKTARINPKKVPVLWLLVRVSGGISAPGLPHRFRTYPSAITALSSP